MLEAKVGQAMSERRELYRSPNGDSWFLGREPTNGHAFIIHQPNAPPGGRLSPIELGEFLRDQKGPGAAGVASLNWHSCRGPAVCLAVISAATRGIGLKAVALSREAHRQLQ